MDQQIESAPNVILISKESFDSHAKVATIEEAEEFVRNVGEPCIVPYPGLDEFKEFNAGTLYTMIGDGIKTVEVSVPPKDVNSIFQEMAMRESLNGAWQNLQAEMEGGYAPYMGRKPWIPDQHPEVPRKERRRLAREARKKARRNR